jgi:hypothetical protein
MLELAQRGIDKNPETELIYAQGNEEIFSRGNEGHILPENLAQVIKDADDPAEMNNFFFSIGQDSPVRRVEIEIGPGDWTRYFIESDDPTWAHGRYHEVTEKLLASRSLYAKGHASAPQVPREGTNEWRPAAWELVSNWRANIANYTIPALWIILIAEIVTITVALSYYYDDAGAKSKVAVSDRHNAEVALNWFHSNSALLAFITFSYVAMIILVRQRMRRLLRSKIILEGRGSSFFSQLGFKRNRDDAIQLATVYLTLLILMVGVAALLVQVSS